jgi:hypothetical protein
MVEITAEPHEEGRAYPITPNDAKKVLENQNGDDLKGLKAVRFEDPKNAPQREAWAQYKRGKREIVIFSQNENEITPQTHMMMKEKVVPHELGHHVALNRRNITDKDLDMAEARADAYAAGFDVEDRDVKRFKGPAKGRAYNYTPTYAAGDLPLIAADGAGTAGAATVALIPLAVTAGAVYVGAKIVKKQVDSAKKSTKKKKKAKK